MLETNESAGYPPIEGDLGVPIPLFPTDRPVPRRIDEDGQIEIEQRVHVRNVGLFTITFDDYFIVQGDDFEEPADEFIEDLEGNERIVLATSGGPSEIVRHNEKSPETVAYRIVDADVVRWFSISLANHRYFDGETELPEVRLSFPGLTVVAEQSDVGYPGPDDLLFENIRDQHGDIGLLLLTDDDNFLRRIIFIVD